MLPVKSILVTQTIPYEQVAQIAAGAQQAVLHNRQEHPQQLSLYERLIDSVFCGSSKQSTLCQIRQMSLVTALLHVELEKPEGARSPMLVNAYTARISENQNRLKKLMAGDTLKFGRVPGRTQVGHDSFLIHRSPTGSRSGIPLTAPGRVGPRPSILLTRDQRYVRDEILAELRQTGQLAYGGRVVQVKFLKYGEPIVLGDCLDPTFQFIQKVLCKNWIIEGARSSLNRLNAIRSNATLDLPVTFPDTESELFSIRMQFKLDVTWDTAKQKEQEQFGKIVHGLEKEIRAETSRLREQFQSLRDMGKYRAQYRTNFLKAESGLSRLVDRQQYINEQLENLRHIYRQLFQLAKDCTSVEMQTIPLGRIEKIREKLLDLTQADKPAVHAEQLGVQLQHTVTFIEKFSSSLALFKQLLTRRPEIVLSDGVEVTLPVSLELNYLIDQLCTVAVNPNESWQNIQAELHKVKNLQDALVDSFTRKLNAGRALNMEFQTFMGEEGLNLETGESFYKPKTYSRIMSLRQIRAELLNQDEYMSDAAIGTKIIEMNAHLPKVHRDTTSIRRHAQSETFEHHTMYLPEMNLDGVTPINFSQWSDEGKGLERELNDRKARGPVE